jgi:uncharacterized membrane protein
MHTPASIKGHPLHPMLVALPIGLWTFSLIADLIYHWGFGGPTWGVVAYYTVAAGIVGALLAAVPGLIDLLSITDPRARRTGIAHMVINLVVVGLYVWNFLLRRAEGAGTVHGIALSVVAIALLCVSGWLGGEMVYVYGIAVEGRPEGKLEDHRPAHR